MKQDLVITNMRIQQDNYTQLKMRAAELGLSVNAYMNWLVQRDISKAQFSAKVKTRKKKNIYDALWELGQIRYEYKPMGASEDDKIIYGMEDE